MKFKALLISFLMLLTSSPAYSKVAPVIRSALSSSARITVGDLVIGSAVAVQSYGKGTIFATNDHVCQWSRGASVLGSEPNFSKPLNSVGTTIQLKDGVKLASKVIFTSNSNNSKKKKPVSNDDLCLVYVESTVPIVKLGSNVEIGEEVFTIGAPHGWFPEVSNGYAGGYFESEGSYVGTASLMIGEGSSGSGVFSKENGDLVGVAFAIEAASKEVPAPIFALYVPVARVKAFLKQYEKFDKEQKK